MQWSIAIASHTRAEARASWMWSWPGFYRDCEPCLIVNQSINRYYWPWFACPFFFLQSVSFAHWYSRALRGNVSCFRYLFSPHSAFTKSHCYVLHISVTARADINKRDQGHDGETHWENWPELVGAHGIWTDRYYFLPFSFSTSFYDLICNQSTQYHFDSTCLFLSS